MPKFHVFLKGRIEAPITVQGDQLPKLGTTEPWLTIGNSSFLRTEIVAIVADDDLPRRRPAVS